MSVFAKKRQLIEPVSIARTNSIWLTMAVWLAICGSVFTFGFGRDFERPKVLCLSFAAAMMIPRVLLIWPTWPRQVRAAVLIWLMVIAASVLFALDPARALIGSFERSQGAFVLVCCTILALARVPAAMIIPPVTVAALVSGIWAIAQYFGWETTALSALGLLEPGLSEPGWHRAFGWRAFASFGNPMALGNWLVIAWVFLFAARFQEKRANYDVFFVSMLNCALVFGAVGLLLSGTRAAWVALSVVALLQFRQNKIFRIAGVFALIACAVVLMNFRTDSVRARVELVQAALSPAKITLANGVGESDRFPAVRPWLGYGPDLQVAFLGQNMAQRRVGEMPDRAHQMLLDGYLSIGVLGVLSWLILAITLWRYRVATIGSVLFALIAAVIAWQFGFALSAEKALCALLVGAMFAPKRQVDTLADYRNAGAWRSIVAAFFTGFAMLSYLPKSLVSFDAFAPWRRPERAIVHFERARLAIMAGQGQTAAQELERAVALDPWRADLLRAKINLAIELGHNVP